MARPSLQYDQENHFQQKFHFIVLKGSEAPFIDTTEEFYILLCYGWRRIVKQLLLGMFSVQPPVIGN